MSGTTQTPAPNRFKAALANKEAQIGFWLSMADAYLAEVSATAGFDWLLIDNEHAPNDVRTTLSQLQALAPYRGEAVVRPVNGDVAPDSLGSYSRRAVTWIEGTYLTLRPSFGDKAAIYAYHTEIAWDVTASSLMFREGERLDVIYTQSGEVAVPHQSGFIYLITNQHGQHRLITVSRPIRSGEMYGIITTLLAGRGSLLTPIAAPIAFLPIKSVAKPSVGRISPGEPNYDVYREHLRRTTDEPFALFLQG